MTVTLRVTVPWPPGPDRGSVSGVALPGVSADSGVRATPRSSSLPIQSASNSRTCSMSFCMSRTYRKNDSFHVGESVAGFMVDLAVEGPTEMTA